MIKCTLKINRPPHSPFSFGNGPRGLEGASVRGFAFTREGRKIGREPPTFHQQNNSERVN